MDTRNEKILADMRAATARNDTIVLSGKMHTSDAEREAVLQASAMLDLADSIEQRVSNTLFGTSAALRLTSKEWQLIAYALRHTADSE